MRTDHRVSRKYQFLIYYTISLQNLRSGSFILTQKGHLIEILQLKKKCRQFVQVVDENTHADIYFAGAQYKSLTTKKFCSNQTLIQKRYYLLKTVYKKTVVPIRRWKENATYYIELQDDTAVSDEDIHDDQGTEEERPNDDSSYCFCRQSSDLDDLIECYNANCKIMWFHFKCVGVSKRIIPPGDWYCPRCQEMDHWCTCGRPEGDNGKRLIGCSCKLCVK